LNDRGRRAEALAAAYLEARGLRVVARNWRCRFGEIDLIARDGPMLVFVEVRARTSRSHGGAAESITAAKRRKLVAAANLYLRVARSDTPCRFDALLFDAAGHAEWLRDVIAAD
jgi:putative endonuclease